MDVMAGIENPVPENGPTQKRPRPEADWEVDESGRKPLMLPQGDQVPQTAQRLQICDRHTPETELVERERDTDVQLRPGNQEVVPRPGKLQKGDLLNSFRALNGPKTYPDRLRNAPQPPPVITPADTITVILDKAAFDLEDDGYEASPTQVSLLALAR